MRMPIVRLVPDGPRTVFQVVGSSIVPPSSMNGMYLGHNGYVTDIAEAVDVRGPVGGSEAGTQGPKGEPGIDGKSAYTLWLEAGNVGSVAAFLASLKGAQGDQGTPGTSGRDGTDGQDGQPGPTGPDRIKFARTLTTNAQGIWSGKVPATATVLKVSPRTDAVLQESISQSGDTVTVRFRRLNTGGLNLTIGTLLTATILAQSVGVVTFDLEASEPTV